MNQSSIELSRLKRGVKYVFHTKDFETPLGDTIPGEAKIRSFVSFKGIGPRGMPKARFVEVERADATRHLIYVDNIRHVELASDEVPASGSEILQ